MSGALLHSPADVIRWLIIGLGGGTNPDLNLAWPVRATREADLPDNCITVYDTTGRDDGRTMTEGERIEHPGILIRIRSSKPKEGFVKAKAIATLLDESVRMNSVAIDSSHYLIENVSRTGNVIPLGPAPKDLPNSERSLFTINAVVKLRQLS